MIRVHGVRHTGKCVVAVLVFSVTALVGCRLDGELRVSDDLARRLPDRARDGGIDLPDMSGFDSLQDSNVSNEGEATFRVYLTPPKDVEEAVTAKIAEGNPDEKELRPDDERFQRARTVTFDTPGGVDALDFVAFDSGIEIRHDGTVGLFLDPVLSVHVAEENVERIYEAADNPECPNEPESVQVASVELDRSLEPADPVTISLREVIERGDDAFRIIERGRFQIGVVFGAGVRAENTDSQISWPERVSWRITDITLTIAATPYEAFR